MMQNLSFGQYYGHSENGTSTSQGVAEYLKDHLTLVANRAAGNARFFGAEDHALVAGLLHDLGKYADQFQHRLQDPSRFPGRDHWSVGAFCAARRYQGKGIYPALAIQGHHIGLTKLPISAKTFWTQLENQFKTFPDRFTEKNRNILIERFQAEDLNLPDVLDEFQPSEKFFASDMLDARMLFSCLVDADFIETEAHFQGDHSEPRRYREDGVSICWDDAIDALSKRMKKIREKEVTEEFRQVRETLFQDCVEKSNQPPGLFTLSAPTGSGKTLSMLAFALRHARKHKLRRIILVMPFLNIIEQSANIYREIFASPTFSPWTILEHHSLARSSQNNDSSQITSANDGTKNLQRFLSENWDAPIVLTTSVQCLESMMAHKPSRCRKLHQLSKSVILFDEVQTIPNSLAVATLATLSRLADPIGPYHSTVLFATATQPAFEQMHARVATLAMSGWQPKEIVSDPTPMFEVAATRIKVKWNHDKPQTLDSLATKLAKQDRVLCIVNLKRHATDLTQKLSAMGVSNVLHLSTNMCPAHREKVIKEVNALCQSESSPIRLVATQCVEAGVDLDFPVVYRALAPMESIAQAAGRCNRHGIGETGKVVVFSVDDEKSQYPPGYRSGVNATQLFLANLQQSCKLNKTNILNSPEHLRHYYRTLYAMEGRDQGDVRDEKELLEAIEDGDFERVDQAYRLIDQDTINILVRYDEQKFEALQQSMNSTQPRQPGFIRDWLREASRYSVSLFRPRKQDDEIWNALEPVQFYPQQPIQRHESDWFYSLDTLGYDKNTGITGEISNCWIC